MPRRPSSTLEARSPGREPGRDRGFSLLELTIALVLTGLLAVGFAGLLRRPVEARADLQRRADLLGLADVALSRLQLDLARAAPRSVRVAGGGTALEFLETIAHGPYRAETGVNDPGGPNEQDHSDPGDRLTFAADDGFNVLGRLLPSGLAYGVPLAAGTRVLVGPLDAASLWRAGARSDDPGPLTGAATTIVLEDDGDEDRITLSTAHTFANASPSQHAYLVGSPITWLCDPNGGALWRIDRYAMNEIQPSLRTAPPLSAARQARSAERVERCGFRVVPGAADAPFLVRIELVLEAEGERIRLLRQIEVGHAP